MMGEKKKVCVLFASEDHAIPQCLPIQLPYKYLKASAFFFFFFMKAVKPHEGFWSESVV